jgi:hypothetical protein
MQGIEQRQGVGLTGRPIAGAPALGDDTLQAELAGVLEDGGAVAIEMFGQDEGNRRTGEETVEARLPVHERLRAQVFLVDEEHVEREHGRGLGTVSRPERVKVGQTLVGVSYALTVEHERGGGQGSDRGGYSGEAACPVATVAAPEPNPITILAGDQAVAVVLDLVQPFRA